jgi:single-strand DNA-binding protein
VVLDRFNSRFQILAGARGNEETAEGETQVDAAANQPVFDKRFAFDELPF